MTRRPDAPLGVVGLSYRTTPLEIRSRLAIPADAIPAILAAARSRGLAECVVLSTCNRTEIYFAGDPLIAVRLLAESAGLSSRDVAPYLYRHVGPEVVHHLFRVASGLDSAVLGETEIVAQVKDAWQVATAAGSVKDRLGPLSQRALSVSKRIRTETDLCRNVTSTGSLAIRRVRARLGSLEDRSLLLLGAGRIAERISKDLRGTGVHLTVLNRTESRAGELANRYGGHAGPLDDLESHLVHADAVLATLGSPYPILTREVVARAMRARNSRPLLIVDLGVPQNYETNPRTPGVEVVHLDELVAVCTANAELRSAALPAALDIVEAEVRRYLDGMVIRNAYRSAREPVLALAAGAC